MRGAVSATLRDVALYPSPLRYRDVDRGVLTHNVTLA